MRTTIAIDLPLVRKIREISHREHKTFKQVLQELLTLGVSVRGKKESISSPFRQWHSRKMSPLVDYSNKESLYRAIDPRT